MTNEVNLLRIEELLKDYYSLTKEEGWIKVPLTKLELAVIVGIIHHYHTTKKEKSS